MASPSPSPSPSPSSPSLFFLFTLLSLFHLSTSHLQLPLLHTNHLPSPTTANSPVTSGASFGTGQYFVTLHLGSPPQPLLLVADTGSDLIWVRCSSSSAAISPRAFLPRLSSSFRPLHCYNPLCSVVPHPQNSTCNLTRLHSACNYDYSYSDGSFSSGIFSAETTTLNTSTNMLTEMNNLHFGCGFRVSGPSVTGPSFRGAQGVMGLGRGPTSFSTHLGRHFGHTFSYCLMDYTSLLRPPATSSSAAPQKTIPTHSLGY